MENSVEVSTKDAPEVVKSMEQAADAIEGMKRERDEAVSRSKSMETALLESGEEINRLRGVVREATQRIAADRLGAASDLVPGELIASGPLLDRKGVIAGIVEQLSPAIYSHCLRMGVDGSEDGAILAAFQLAEKIFDAGVARGIYDQEQQGSGANSAE